MKISINNILDEMNLEGVQYVHFKSNTYIDDSLNYVGDLDLLISPQSKELIYDIFNKYGVIECNSYKDAWQSEVFHFVALNSIKKVLIHFHLHFQLPIGFDFDKNFVLPIVDSYIKSKQKYKNIFLPQVEYEYILLILRLILKNNITSFLVMKPTKQIQLLKNRYVINSSQYDEFTDLNNKINKEEVVRVVNKVFYFISIDMFYQCEQVLINNNSLFNYFYSSHLLTRKLKCFGSHGQIMGFIFSLIRINEGRLNTLINKKYFKKKSVNGGRIIAFVGGDGAGKTTNIQSAYNILNKHLYVKSIHFGRPDRGFIGRVITTINKFFLLINKKELALAINYLSVAYDRRRAYNKALNVRKNGGIVLLDRMYMEGIDAMDCPRIQTIGKRNFRILSRIEKYCYSKISPVDLLIVLRLNPKIAIERRPNDDVDALINRSGQIWNKDFSEYDNAVIIDTAEEESLVQSLIVSKIWSNISKKE